MYINGLLGKLREGLSLATTSSSSSSTVNTDFQPTVTNQPRPPLQPPFQYIACLLYADDVAFIGGWDTIPRLLALCEQHSYELGYRWNPTKCVVLYDNNLLPNPLPPLTLYKTPLPRANTFTYLGVPISAKGNIHTGQLIDQRTTKALNSIHVFHTMSLSPHGFSRLLSSRIYRQFVRPTMEYGLALARLNNKQLTALDAAQGTCLLPPPYKSHPSFGGPSNHMRPSSYFTS